jgi:hypothetical protein
LQRVLAHAAASLDDARRTMRSGPEPVNAARQRFVSTNRV